MHHINKLGDLSGKENWEKLMIARRRKTLALCENCHKMIHYGTNQTDNVSGKPDTRERVRPVWGRVSENLPQQYGKALGTQPTHKFRQTIP